MIEVKQVIIPKRDENGYLIGTRKVVAKWICPTCGEKMGQPIFYNFCEDESWHTVHVWKNSCGHIAKYKELIILQKVY